MLNDTLSAMREAGRQLDAFLARYRGAGSDSSTPDLKPLADALEIVERRLREAPLPAEMDPISRTEVNLYAAKLTEFKSVLERLQPQLERRRADLRGRLARIRAALDWVDSFNQTR